jgi:hypothetical protein
MHLWQIFSKLIFQIFIMLVALNPDNVMGIFLRISQINNRKVPLLAMLQVEEVLEELLERQQNQILEMKVVLELMSSMVSILVVEVSLQKN